MSDLTRIAANRLAREGKLDLAQAVNDQQAKIERLCGALERIEAIPIHHVGWRDIAKEALAQEGCSHDWGDNATCRKCGLYAIQGALAGQPDLDTE